MHPQDELERLEALVATFYSAFDNRNGRSPSIQGITELLLADSIIAKGTGGSFELYTPAQFAQPRIALLRGGELQDFHEWETSASTEVHQQMACRRSTYAKEGVLGAAPYSGTGTKFFQFIKVDGAWRILSLTWIDDPA